MTDSNAATRERSAAWTWEDVRTRRRLAAHPASPSPPRADDRGEIQLRGAGRLLRPHDIDKSQVETTCRALYSTRSPFTFTSSPRGYTAHAAELSRTTVRRSCAQLQALRRRHDATCRASRDTPGSICLFVAPPRWWFSRSLRAVLVLLGVVDPRKTNP